MPVPQWPHVPGDDETFGMNEKKELKKQWKSMSPKEKIGYFKDYYLLWVAGGALIVGLLFTMIWKALHPAPERQLFVYVFNDVLSDEAEKETVEAFCREYGLSPDLIEISDGHDPDADALLFATFTGDAAGPCDLQGERLCGICRRGHVLPARGCLYGGGA